MLIVFVILWALWLAGFLNNWTQTYIATGEVTGIEAFLLGNINLWILIGVVVFAAWTLRGSGADS